MDGPLCRAPGRVIVTAVQTPALLQTLGGEHDGVGGDQERLDCATRADSAQSLKRG
jgi:hypothetical protein